jgi:hypothetical protein
MPRVFNVSEDWVSYIPEIDNNREDPDPLCVELHPMSAEEHRAHQRGLVTGKGQDIMARAHRITERIFKERVRNVRGYVMHGKAITTGEELYKLGETDVIDDIMKALTNISTLSEGLLGKSKSQSVSPLPGTMPPVSGGVPSVRGTEAAMPSAPNEIATVNQTQI